LSALAGVALFGFAVQAQNLFADRSFAGFFEGVPYWFLVFALVFVAWAFPIHYNARRTLTEDAWLLPYRFRIHITRAASHTAVHELRERRLPDRMDAQSHCLDSVRRDPGWTVGLSGRHQRRRRAAGGGRGEDPTLAPDYSGIIFRFRRVSPTFPVTGHARLDARRPNSNVRRRTNKALEGFYRVSAALTLLIFFVAYTRPEELADRAPRAMLAPLLLGSLVIFLGWVAREGNRRGVPALTAIIAIFVLATGLNTRLNDVRVLKLANEKHFENRQIDIREAVNRWRSANGCEAETSSCPPALIVAAEGGASRAAFMTATVIGHLIDREGELGDRPDQRAPGRRIFAISGVSGGASGAAVVRAAIEDSLAAPETGPPCANPQRNWFSNPVGGAKYKTSWRSCLQLLVSGDYLSSAFVGFGFRDNFAPPGFVAADRAALLEQAWERHYDYVVHEKPSGSQRGRDCDENSSQGLCRTSATRNIWARVSGRLSCFSTELQSTRAGAS
jgi:hypothetical protein